MKGKLIRLGIFIGLVALGWGIVAAIYYVAGV